MLWRLRMLFNLKTLFSHCRISNSILASLLSTHNGSWVLWEARKSYCKIVPVALGRNAHRRTIRGSWSIRVVNNGGVAVGLVLDFNFLCFFRKSYFHFSILIVNVSRKFSDETVWAMQVEWVVSFWICLNILGIWNRFTTLYSIS